MRSIWSSLGCQTDSASEPRPSRANNWAPGIYKSTLARMVIAMFHDYTNEFTAVKIMCSRTGEHVYVYAGGYSNCKQFDNNVFF